MSCDKMLFRMVVVKRLAWYPPMKLEPKELFASRGAKDLHIIRAKVSYIVSSDIIGYAY